MRRNPANSVSELKLKGGFGRAFTMRTDTPWVGEAPTGRASFVGWRLDLTEDYRNKRYFKAVFGRVPVEPNGDAPYAIAFSETLAQGRVGLNGTIDFPASELAALDMSDTVALFDMVDQLVAQKMLTSKLRQNPVAEIYKWRRDAQGVLHVEYVDVDDGDKKIAPGFVFRLFGDNAGAFEFMGAEYKRVNKKWKLARTSEAAQGRANLRTGKIDTRHDRLTEEAHYHLRAIVQWLRHEVAEHGKIPPRRSR